MSKVPDGVRFVCQGCAFLPLEVKFCNVRTMHIAPHKQVCPREIELAEEQKAKQKEPKKK